MEEALSRKLQPAFIEAFFRAALDDVGGRIAPRETGRFEITRVPATVRSRDREVAAGGPLQNAYERVTFDTGYVSIGPAGTRAELLSPGHPLLNALIATTLDRHGATLPAGTTLIDPTDDSDTVRALIYLEHAITDGRLERGGRRIVSRRFQFVEITEHGAITDPGAEPYLNYEPLDDTTSKLLSGLDTTWANDGIDLTGRSWATANLATPHYAEVADITRTRIERTRRAVEERLDSEIRYWDARAAELKQQELHGKKPRLNSGRARQRADDLEARKARRLRELDHRSRPRQPCADGRGSGARHSHWSDPTPRGEQPREIDSDVIVETDRRAVAAVMAAERVLGRFPVEQDHNNPGFDILSEDPRSGRVYQIEVKGHRPDTPEIKVRARQVRQAQAEPGALPPCRRARPERARWPADCELLHSAVRQIRAALRADLRAPRCR